MKSSFSPQTELRRASSMAGIPEGAFTALVLVRLTRRLGDYYSPDEIESDFISAAWLDGRTVGETANALIDDFWND